MKVDYSSFGPKNNNNNNILAPSSYNNMNYSSGSNYDLKKSDNYPKSHTENVNSGY